MMRASVFVLILMSLALAGSATAQSTQEFKFLGGMETPVVSFKFKNLDEGGAAFSGPTREEVNFQTTLAPGSIVVKTAERRLYYILPAGRALAFAVGVGREGYEWSGENRVTRKAEWPDWRPPAQMIAREAENGHLIPTFVRGGPGNPLGARAIYIGDTEYRIHGTDKPWSIGQASSSGCIRMLNDNVTELYDLVQVGAHVVVQ
jgi:lipoprotein-anchoring transpeptidase ErfK/SrfK